MQFFFVTLSTAVLAAVSAVSAINDQVYSNAESCTGALSICPPPDTSLARTLRTLTAMLTLGSFR